MDYKIDSSEAFVLPELDYSEPPVGSDRRAFMMRSAMVVAIVALGGCKSENDGKVAAKSPPIGAGEPDANLNVMKKSKGPVILARRADGRYPQCKNRNPPSGTPRPGRRSDGGRPSFQGQPRTAKYPAWQEQSHATGQSGWCTTLRG